MKKPKKSKQPKKYRKATVIKKLQKKAEDFWKGCCFKRDGYQCQVQKQFPEINIHHSGVLQVDHCISRKCKHTFLDVCNGTVVCSSCNSAKAWGNKAVALAIDQIVINREGKDVFDRMVEQQNTLGPCLKWRDPAWLEEQVRILEGMVNEEKL